jgi:hypothetical protein
MRIRITQRLSLVKGKRLEPGDVVDVGEEIAVDLIERGLAEPVKAQPERAVTAR